MKKRETKIFDIVMNDSLSICSDLDKFIICIQLGIEGETFYEVGYSSPNYADIFELNAECWNNFKQFCQSKIDTYVHNHSTDSVLLNNLLTILKAVNLEFNLQFDKTLEQCKK